MFASDISINPRITDLLFESTAEEGAILTLPHGAYSQDVINTLRLRSYIARHVESWYKYVIGVRGCEVKNGDIRLVIGCDKTDLWGMAAFVKSSETVRLKYQPIRQGETYKWEYSGAFDTRTGPDPQNIDRLRVNAGQTIYNQCVFARTLNANLREDIWKGIVGDIYAEIGLDPEEAFKEDSHYSAAVLHSGSTTTSSSRGSETSSRQTPNVSMRMVCIHLYARILLLQLSSLSCRCLIPPIWSTTFCGNMFVNHSTFQLPFS